MSYIDAREAWLNTQCHADSTVARGLLKKGADWGREYETLANVDKFCNRTDLDKLRDDFAETAVKEYGIIHRLESLAFRFGIKEGWAEALATRDRLDLVAPEVLAMRDACVLFCMMLDDNSKEFHKAHQAIVDYDRARGET